jgi:hypothetical protein
VFVVDAKNTPDERWDVSSPRFDTACLARNIQLSITRVPNVEIPLSPQPWTALFVLCCTWQRALVSANEIRRVNAGCPSRLSRASCHPSLLYGIERESPSPHTVVSDVQMHGVPTPLAATPSSHLASSWDLVEPFSRSPRPRREF